MTLAKGTAFVKISPLMRLRLGYPLAALLLLAPLNLRGVAAPANAVTDTSVEALWPKTQLAAATEPASVQSTDQKTPPAWVVEPPGSETQVGKSVKSRGVNPCMAPDPGFRGYTEWDRSPSIGQMILPQKLKLGPRGEFDVFVHFHGHEPARKAWVQAMESAVFVGIDLGVGSGAYLDKFQMKETFEALLSSIEEGVASHLSVDKARIRRLGISSWSAGYGAVSQILRDKAQAKRVDSVVLLDGLHSGFVGESLEAEKLLPFVDFARAASRGEKLMFVSHSSIIPPDYASTTQTANYLIWKTGGTPSEARGRSGDPMGLDLISRYSHGKFHVRGFSGNEALDHCAHLALFKDVLRAHVIPRWGK